MRRTSPQTRKRSDSFTICSEPFPLAFVRRVCLQRRAISKLTHRGVSPEPSVLVLHLLPCPLLSLLTQTSLSSTLTHVIAHPPALITHLATAYFAPPPPAGPAEKFWGVFIPISERAHEIQRLVYGPDGNGTCTGAENDVKEFVVELIIRGSGAESRKRTTQRTLEAWKGDAPASLEKLECLLSIFSRKQVSEVSSKSCVLQLMTLSAETLRSN